MKTKILLPFASIALLFCSCVSAPKNEIPLLGEKPISHFEEKIAPGMVYSYQRYEKLFKTPLSISILKIDPKKSGLKLGFRMCSDKRLTTETFGKQFNAVAAVNAGYFYMRSKPPRPAWGRKIDGKVVQKFEHIKKGGVVTFSQDGKTVRILPSKNAEAYDPEKDPAPYACISQPMLVWKGKKYIENPDPDNKNTLYAPRTAIAVCSDGSVILLVADGRTPQSKGLRFSEIQDILIRHFHVSEALAMDGGGSSAMWIRGKGIVSNPSDNRKFDHKGTRPVHDSILVF